MTRPSNSVLRRIARVLRLSQTVALVLVGFLGAMLVSNARAYGDANDWVAHTHQVLDELDQLRITLLRGSVALRDFALVPKETALERARGASKDALTAARRLEALVQDNNPQSARALEVISETRELTGWLLSSAVVGERDGIEELQRLLKDRITADGARRLRQLLDEMEQAERALLTARETDADAQLAALKGWSIGIGAVFLSFTLATFIYSGRLVRSGDRHLVRLTASANTDALTGLANRRALQRSARQLKGQAMSVLAFDLDDFKPVNDRLGHAAGDEVLRAVSQRLREQCRDEDVAARVGGDEFVVLFPGLTDTQRLAQIGERIRDAVAVPIAVEGTEVRIGASIGHATTTGEMSFEALLALADSRSYESKKLRKSAPRAAA